MSAAAKAAPILAGFADPVHDAQRIFRQILAAMAHPGRIAALSGMPEAPAPLHRTTAAICLALVDHETPLWLDAMADEAAVCDFLRFQCGCPLVTVPAASRFAVVANADNAPALADFCQGDPAYPERSTTVIVQVAALHADGPITLSGPGIAMVTKLGIDGLPARFWSEWTANHGDFPCGVDVLLAAPDAIAALPRTTKAEA
jgi:alpha-D-ribose 1-methylphosphonate 5-triphosphate synthase subunit PhnH